MNLYVRSYGDFVLYPPDRESRKQVDFGEIFWPVDGQGIFYQGKQKFILRPGHAWYYPPGTLHDYMPQNRFHYCWLTVAGWDCKKFFELLRIKPGLNKAGICPRHLFRMIETDIELHGDKHRLSALATAFKILALISGGDTEEAKPNEDISEIKSYIDENYGDSALSVEQLAANAGMHRGSLSRAFRKTYGISISNYIISCRMKNAVEMLSSTSYSIAEIAANSGLSSAHYFSKAFARKIGFTPNEFRKRFRNFPADQ